MKTMWTMSFLLGTLIFAANAHSAIELYNQDFETPAAFVNDGGDINIFNHVNTLYGNQPPGFLFAQAATVETLLITGNQAFGTGYSDASGTGGNYAVSMQSGTTTPENDLLGLSFDVGTNDFLNMRINISSIDLDRFGAPFVPTGGSIPIFEFSLFDNPSGGLGVGGGTLLDSAQATGTVSDRDVFDWTEHLLALDASGSTNGNVILRFDLIDGGYAAFDNILIAASDTSGDFGVPEPSALSVWGLGILVAMFAQQRRKTADSTV